MSIRVGSDQYDSETLTRLGGGTYAEVYLLNDTQALKVLYEPSETDRRHIMELCTAARVLDTAHLDAGVISVPLQEAYELPADAVCGFTMNALIHRTSGVPRAWPSITKYAFDLAKGSFPAHAGFTFDDRSASRTLLQVFQLLLALESRRLVFCDLSGKNILFDPVTQKPGVVDTDSFKHQNSESQSQGTEGFVDPRLLELALNSVGGYHFDAKSDIYAATVLAYRMLIGVMPGSVPSDPPMSPDEAARKRLSWARLLVQGSAPFEAAGHKVVQSPATHLVTQRYKSLQATAKRIPDLAILLAHFDSVFVAGGRENPVLSLDTTDRRSPQAQRLDDMGNQGVIADLRAKYGLARSRKVAPRQEQPDPTHLRTFLALRGMRLPQLEKCA